MSRTSNVRQVLLIELASLRREIEAFPDDQALWAARPGVTNTAGTLGLHIAGNLQHFIGARLGGTGYVRQRDLEFSRRGVSRAEILDELDKAAAAVRMLEGIPDDSIPTVYPDVFGGKQVNTDVMLLFLAVHLAYHLGQVDYYRRLTLGDGATVDAIPAKELPPAR